jgi:hypothetical protein
LQGQADYLVNVGVSYSAPVGFDASLLMNAIGNRLRTLGLNPLPDVYSQPFTTLDATMAMRLGRSGRIKFSAKNLLDPRIRQLQNGKEVSGYESGRSYSLSFSMGS